MSRTTLTRTDKAYLASITDGCWSCGETATRPDGLCRDCGTIDAQAVPDIHDPKWKGHGYATSDVMVAPPNAKHVG